MMTRAETAFTVMAESKMNCAQAVLTAFCEELGLDRATALKLARGFGGGMGRSGKTCGAVTGAYMVLGLREPKDAREGIEAVYAQVNDFNRKFTELNGSTECKALLGCDINTPEGLARARAEGLFTKVCPGFVRAAVELLDE
jgi:C_GCAxxG_C_C family probable redox protein